MDIDTYILKYAVNIKQLTKAYKHTVKPRIVGLKVSKGRDLPKGEARAKSGKAFTRPGNLSQGAIINRGDTSKLMIRYMNKNGIGSYRWSGETRNLVNRITGLHEAKELASKGSKKFFTHRGPGPVLNDLTIANTLTGKGAKDAAKFIRINMSGKEVRELEKLIPEIKSWSIQTKRINRRQKKHIVDRYNGLK